MKLLIQYAVCYALFAGANQAAIASGPRINHGNDPFFQISTAIAHCPVPLGPLQTNEEWLDDAHYRVERGNSCWVEGRCRLSNAYKYDGEIAETVQRRLNAINATLHWHENSTLWLTLQRRFIYVQGCVSKDFDTAKFLSELAQTADVDQVIDDSTSSPYNAPLPYKLPGD
ncbi:hypothetical protein [Caballeronia sp. 15711]|uniref:hypothetical protein n=1 Tax=Caballeronia sp. 15711 TaxID=3391029 RepID=UPI0039E3AE4B